MTTTERALAQPEKCGFRHVPTDGVAPIFTRPASLLSVFDEMRCAVALDLLGGFLEDEPC